MFSVFLHSSLFFLFSIPIYPAMEWFNAVRETQAQMEKFIWEEDDMLSSILGVRDKNDKSIQHLEIRGTVPMPCVPVNAADPAVIHKTRTRLMTHRARQKIKHSWQ